MDNRIKDANYAGKTYNIPDPGYLLRPSPAPHASPSSPTSHDAHKTHILPPVIISNTNPTTQSHISTPKNSGLTSALRPNSSAARDHLSSHRTLPTRGSTYKVPLPSASPTPTDHPRNYTHVIRTRNAHKRKTLLQTINIAFHFSSPLCFSLCFIKVHFCFFSSSITHSLSEIALQHQRKKKRSSTPKRNASNAFGPSKHSPKSLLRVCIKKAESGHLNKVAGLGRAE